MPRQKKTIYITEDQFRRLIEGTLDNSAPDFDGKQEEYNDSETSITANITDRNGELKRSKPTDTDDFAKTQVPQNYWLMGVRGGRI